MAHGDFNNLSPNGYILIDTYGVLAFPVELIQQLTGVIRLNQKYVPSSKPGATASTTVYELAPEELLTGRLMSTEKLKAIIAAAKLEEGNG